MALQPVRRERLPAGHGGAVRDRPFEAFNVLDTPRFNNPGGNVSNLKRNADGSIRNLNGFGEIVSTFAGSERQVRFGVRFGF